jgi:hypothetical protein
MRYSIQAVVFVVGEGRRSSWQAAFSSVPCKSCFVDVVLIRFVGRAYPHWAE